MTRPVTFTDAPDTMTPAELHSVQDDVDLGLTHKRILHTGFVFNHTTAVDQLIGHTAQSIISPATTGSLPNSGVSAVLFWYDPADWLSPVNSMRTPKLELFVSYHRNAVAMQNTSLTLSLVRVSGWGSGPGVTSLATIASSSVSFTSADGVAVQKTTGALNMIGATAGFHAIRMQVVGTSTTSWWGGQASVYGYAS